MVSNEKGPTAFFRLADCGNEFCRQLRRISQRAVGASAKLCENVAESANAMHPKPRGDELPPLAPAFADSRAQRGRHPPFYLNQ